MKKIINILLFIILINCFGFCQNQFTGCFPGSSQDVPVVFNGTQAAIASNQDWNNKTRFAYIFNVKPAAYTVINLYIRNRDTSNTHINNILCIADTSDSSISTFSTNIGAWDISSVNFGYGSGCVSIPTGNPITTTCSFIVRNAAQVALQWRSDGCSVACAGTYDLILDIGSSNTTTSPAILSFDNNTSQFKLIPFDPCSQGLALVPSQNVAITITAGSTTNIGVTPITGGHIFLCSVQIGIATTGQYQILEGTHTTTDCDTNNTNITALTDLTKGNVISIGNGSQTAFRTTRPSNNICVKAVTGNVEFSAFAVSE